MPANFLAMFYFASCWNLNINLWLLSKSLLNLNVNLPLHKPLNLTNKTHIYALKLLQTNYKCHICIFVTNFPISLFVCALFHTKAWSSNQLSLEVLFLVCCMKWHDVYGGGKKNKEKYFKLLKTNQGSLGNLIFYGFVD